MMQMPLRVPVSDRLGFHILPEKEEEDVGELMWKYLTPPIKSHVVRFRDVVLFGRPESGKTTMQRAMAFYVINHYGEENVSVAESQSLQALVEHMMANPDKKVHVLIVDDPLKQYHARGGKSKEAVKDIARFVEIRHKLEEGMTDADIPDDEKDTGVVIIIFGTQIFSGLDKTYRFGGIKLFKTNCEEDNESIRRIFGEKWRLMEKLEKLTDDIYIHCKDHRKSDVIAVVGSHIGEVHIPPAPPEYYPIKVTTQQKETEKENIQWNKRVQLLCEEIERESGVNLTGKVFEWWPQVETWIRHNKPAEWEISINRSKLKDIKNELITRHSIAEAPVTPTQPQPEVTPEQSNEEETDEPEEPQEIEIKSTYFNYNETEEIIRFIEEYNRNPKHIYGYLMLYYPQEAIRLIKEGKIKLTRINCQYNEDDVIAQLKKPDLNQEVVASIIGMSQYNLSNQIGRGNKKAKAFHDLINFDRGKKYESYTYTRLKNGAQLCYKVGEQEHILIDPKWYDIKADGRTGMTDLTLTHKKDKHKIFISLKSCWESGGRSVNKDEIDPEVEAFEDSLTEDYTTPDKLMVLLRNIYYEDFLSCYIIQTNHYEQKSIPWIQHIEEKQAIPYYLTFSRARIENNDLPALYWKDENEEYKTNIEQILIDKPISQSTRRLLQSFLKYYTNNGRLSDKQKQVVDDILESFEEEPEG